MGNDSGINQVCGLFLLPQRLNEVKKESWDSWEWLGIFPTIN